MADNDSDIGAFLSGFMLGGLVGAAVALILAPQSGEETRAQIRQKGIELRDQALETAKSEGQDVDKVLVWRRHSGKYMSQTPMIDGRDFFMDELLKKYFDKKVDPVAVD